jgi:Protein of unknown function (DUF4239)
MVTVTQNVAVILATVIASLLLMAALNRVWPREKRQTHNDLIGWQLSILGTTYAVILGFMLYTVWTSLVEADRNVGLEANAVVDIYRLADGMPEPQRTQLQTLSRSYVNAAITQEWPEMAKGEAPSQTSAINREMWKTVMAVRAASPTEVNAQENALSQLSLLAQHRLTRALQSATELPSVLWWVLLVGGTLTIVSACTFGTESLRLQMLQVFSFSLLVSLSLVAIADIHRPFYGLIHVNDSAFRRAQQSMQVP